MVTIAIKNASLRRNGCTARNGETGAKNNAKLEEKNQRQAQRTHSTEYISCMYSSVLLEVVGGQFMGSLVSGESGVAIISRKPIRKSVNQTKALRHVHAAVALLSGHERKTNNVCGATRFQISAVVLINKWAREFEKRSIYFRRYIRRESIKHKYYYGINRFDLREYYYIIL